LTNTTLIDTSVFRENLDRIHQMGTIVVAITKDSSGNFEIIASGTIIIEPKIMRGGKSVGHIEDIVVSQEMRGKNISHHILQILKTIAKENNCYKVILNTDTKCKSVYLKNGFTVKAIQMAEYLSDFIYKFTFLSICFTTKTIVHHP